MSNWANNILGIQLTMTGTQQVAAGFNQVAQAATGTANSVQQASQKASSATQQLARQTATNFSAIRYGFDQFGRMVMPVIGSVMQMAMASKELEERFVSLRKGMKVEEYAKFGRELEDQAKMLGGRYAIAAGKAADAVTALHKANLPIDAKKERDAAMRFFFLSEETDFTKGAERLMQMKNALGRDIADLSPKIHTAGVEAVGGPREMAKGIANAIPAINSLNQSLDTTMAIFMKMADYGLTGSKAGTAFNALTTQLKSEPGMTSSFLKEIEIAGGGVLKVQDSVNGKVRDHLEIVKDLAVSLEKIKQANPTWVDMFLNKIGKVQGGRELAILMKEFEKDRFSDLYSKRASVAASTPERLADIEKMVRESPAITLDKLSSVLESTKHSIFATFFGTSSINSGLSMMADEIQNVGKAYVAMYRDGIPAAEIAKTIGEKSVGYAQAANSFLLSLQGALSDIVAPIKALFDLFSNDGGGFVLGKLVGWGAAFTGLGLALGLVGLAVRGFQQAAQFISPVLTPLVTQSAVLSNTTKAMSGGFSMTQVALTGLKPVLVELYIWFAQLNTTLGLTTKQLNELRITTSQTLFTMPMRGGPGTGPGGAPLPVDLNSPAAYPALMMAGLGWKDNLGAGLRSGWGQFKQGFFNIGPGPAGMGWGLGHWGARWANGVPSDYLDPGNLQRFRVSQMATGGSGSSVSLHGPGAAFAAMGSGLVAMGKAVAGAAVPLLGWGMLIYSLIDAGRSWLGVTKEQVEKKREENRLLSQSNAMRQAEELAKGYIKTFSGKNFSPEYLAKIAPYADKVLFENQDTSPSGLQAFATKGSVATRLADAWASKWRSRANLPASEHQQSNLALLGAMQNFLPKSAANIHSWWSDPTQGKAMDAAIEQWKTKNPGRQMQEAEFQQIARGIAVPLARALPMGALSQSVILADQMRAAEEQQPGGPQKDVLAADILQAMLNDIKSTQGKDIVEAINNGTEEQKTMAMALYKVLEIIAQERELKVKGAMQIKRGSLHAVINAEAQIAKDRAMSPGETIFTRSASRLEYALP